MSKSKLVRLADSPILRVCLLLLAVASAAASYRKVSGSSPPPLSGFSWSQHPDTLLLAVPPGDCGCGLPLTEWIRTAASHNLHVLIVSKADGDVAAVKQVGFPTRRVSILADMDARTIKQLAPRDQTTAMLVRGGQVTSKLLGGLPPAKFFDG